MNALHCCGITVFEKVQRMTQQHPNRADFERAPKPEGGRLAYDPTRTYRWNYEHPPTNLGGLGESLTPADLHAEDLTLSSNVETRRRTLDCDFLGLPVGSPIGVAAGPLLNGAWCLHYAALGYDVLTYKTVRSVSRGCYEMPNLVPVANSMMTGAEQRVLQADVMKGSWAVSFGMPSSPPEVWRRDIEETRRRLDPTKVLSVSVVGTYQEGWSLERLAEDYALCAKWAVESGADVVEANFSCPNVSTCDGQLYQNAKESNLVASVIREAIEKIPLVIKIGFVPDEPSVEKLVSSLDGVVQAISMTNSLASQVVGRDGERLFRGEQRGICGDAIREASVAQVQRFHQVIHQRGSEIKLIGVGGIRSNEHVRDYLRAGASACQVATAAMTDPFLTLDLSRLD